MKCGTFTIFVLLSLYSTSDSAEPRKIPLDEIWGYNLPGTRDLAGIPLPETEQTQNLGQSYGVDRRQREQNVEQIRRSLTIKAPSEQAFSGFVMARQPDFWTLHGVSTRVANTMLHQKADMPAIDDQCFEANQELTLVFFSHPASYYVRLKNVERRGSDIVIHYQFEPHARVETTVHFALIPLGKLPVGTYYVRCQQLPIESKYLNAGFKPVHPEASTIICRPFSFRVTRPASADVQLSAKEATEIPLSQVWANKMPGTRDILSLEPDSFLLLQEIDRSLRVVPREETASFAVSSAGISALREAHAVLWGREKPDHTLPIDNEISLVFYSHLLSQHIHLQGAVQRGNVIEVRYRFAPSEREVTETQIALIPLGKLTSGQYGVNMIQLPKNVDLKLASDAKTRQVVSESFSFSVEQHDAQDGAEIPLDEIWGWEMPGTRNLGELDVVKTPTGTTRHPIINHLLRSLDFQYRPKEGEKTTPAFVIVGNGKEALMNAHDIFTKQREPSSTLPSNTELTLVFYSYASGRYVRIVSVEQVDKLITVNYRFVAHATADMSRHFALIPLGKMTEGTFQVKINQLPPVDEFGRQAAPMHDLTRIVSDSFSFEVQE